MKPNGTWMDRMMSLGAASIAARGVACVMLLGTACGDDDATMPDAGTGADAAPGVDAAPGSDAGPGDDAQAADAGTGATAFLVGSSYAGVGVASILDLPSLELTANAIDGVASDDPVLRYFDGLVYVINRFGHDNVTIVDPSTRMLVAQISTGAGSNPQDVAPRGSLLYVAALNAPGILVLDTERPQDGVIGTIDLSALDPDGIPDCSSVYLVGDTLYATCGVLDGFNAVRPGVVAVIDTAANIVITSFDMQTRNPLGFLQATPTDSALGGDLLVATVDYADGNNGCIERIDIDAGGEPDSTCLVSNTTLGGYAGGLAYQPATDTLYVARIAGFDDGGPVGALVTYDVALDALAEEPITPAEQRAVDIARCPTGELVVADALAGVRVFTAEGTELTDAALDIGLPPVGNGAVCF